MIHFIFIFFLTNANAASLIRIDKSAVEELTPFSHKYELIIEENCSHCMTQLTILKDCVEDKDVVVFMDNRSNTSEEKLKRIVKRKKIPYKTFILSDDFRKTYDFKGITPFISITKSGKSKSFTGVVTCEQLKI